MVAIVKHNAPVITENVELFRKIAAHPPGLCGPVELSVTRPMTTAWISEGLLARTIDVWSRAYDRPVTTQEAMEILMNVKRFGKLLIRAKEGNKA